MSLLCFFGHHRCASSWVNDILRGVCNAAGWRQQTVHNAKTWSDETVNLCHRQQVDLLSFSNAKWEYLSELPSFVGLHLVRDPRDVLVSSYFAHCYSHPVDQWPELISHRRELQRLSAQEGLLLELSCRAEEFEDMRAWRYDGPNIFELKVEALIVNPLAKMNELFAFWGRLEAQDREAPRALRVFFNSAAARTAAYTGWHRMARWKMSRVYARILRHVVEKNDYKIKSGGCTRGHQNVHHHYRSGVPGDWRNHFSDELSRQYKARYNDVLVKLGYENDADW